MQKRMNNQVRPGDRFISWKNCRTRCLRLNDMKMRQSRNNCLLPQWIFIMRDICWTWLYVGQKQMKNAFLTLYRCPGKFANLTETSGREKSIFYVFALSLSLPSSFESKISTGKKGKCVRRIVSLPPHIFLFRPPFYVMVYTFSSPVHISSPFFLPTAVLRGVCKWQVEIFPFKVKLLTICNVTPLQK